MHLRRRWYFSNWPVLGTAISNECTSLRRRNMLPSLLTFLVIIRSIIILLKFLLVAKFQNIIMRGCDLWFLTVVHLLRLRRLISFEFVPRRHCYALSASILRAKNHPGRHRIHWLSGDLIYYSLFFFNFFFFFFFLLRFHTYPDLQIFCLDCDFSLLLYLFIGVYIPVTLYWTCGTILILVPSYSIVCRGCSLAPLLIYVSWNISFII